MNKIILLGLAIFAGAAYAEDTVKSSCTSESYSGTIVTQCVDGTSTIVRSTGEIVVCKADKEGKPVCTSLGGDK